MARLSVLYIVRNEQDLIERSLVSLQPIADEVIVVDTGSMDKTLKICRKFPFVRIFGHAWLHDFSQTRNYGIRQCTGDWILSMSADEMLDPGSASAIRTAVNNAKQNVAAFGLRIVDHETALDPRAPTNSTSFFGSPQIRLFRKHKQIVFEGKVGESVTRTAKIIGGIDVLDADIHHFLWRGKGEEYKKGRLAYYSKLGGNFQLIEPEPVVQVQASQTAIVVVAHNVLDATKECVVSIARHTPGPHELVLVDNGSNDGTYEYMKGATTHEPPRLTQNRGVAAGRNLGARQALGDPGVKYICFLDNDTKVSEGWLAEMVRIMDANSKVGIIGPLSNNADTPQNIYEMPDSQKKLEARDPEHFFVDSINRFCMLVSTDMARKVGLFDESLGMYGCEEKDLCIRAKQAGYEVAVANRVFIEHRGRATINENKMDGHKLINDSTSLFMRKWPNQPVFDGPRSPDIARPIANSPYPKLSFVILSHNRLDMTRDCINSILSTCSNFELVLVDNASTDKTVEWVKHVVPSAVIIRNDRNLGVPMARNQGVRATTGEFLIVMDNDIVLRPGWLDDMFTPIRDGADMVGIEGWQLDHNFGACYQCQSANERFDYLGGALTVIRRKVFETVGLYDEGFSPAYYEDSLTGDRLVPIKREGRIDVVPLASLFEMGIATKRGDGKEEVVLAGIETLAVNPDIPCPILDEKNLPEWWTSRFLSARERTVYEYRKNGVPWCQAEKLAGFSGKGYVGTRIKRRISRSRKEEVLAEWMPLEKIVRHKTNKPIVKVESKYGHTQCTCDHSLMVWDGEKLKEQVPGNMLGETPASVSCPVLVQTDSGYKVPIRHSKTNKGFAIFDNDKGEDYCFPLYIDYSTKLAKAWFETLGEFVSEGSVCGNVISICGKSKNDIERVAANLSLLTNRKIEVHKYKDEGEREIRGHRFNISGYVYRATICNGPIAELFQTLCGKGTKNKMVPSCVFTAPIGMKELFLKHLCRGDGYNFNTGSKFESAYSDEYKQTAFRFSTTSLSLSSGLCLLLSTMGKRYSVGYDEKKGEYKVDHVHYRKNSSHSVSVKPVPRADQYVYDLSVANHHTFVDAMGLLVVHNTDFSVRARVAGMKLRWVQTTKVHHRQHATLIHGQKEFKYQEALSKSYVRFAAKMRGQIKVEHQRLMPMEKKLKLLYLGMQYDYGVRERGYSFEHDNFYPSFLAWPRAKMTHFDFVDLGQQHGIPRMSDMLYDMVMMVQPDVIFTVFFDEAHDPRRDVFDKIRRTTPTKVISWFCDSHYRYENFDRPWAEHVDFCVTTSTDAWLKYQRDGLKAKVIKSQWAVAPNYTLDPTVSKNIDVSFVGQPHGDRKQVVDQLRRAGIDVQTYGHGWGQRLNFTQMVSVFNRSRINLNLNNAADARHKQIKGRNFEVPGSGGFLLTGTAENLHEYYEYGKEIAVFNSTDEIIHQVQHYLAHEDERAAVAKAGHERTIREHTYGHRFDKIFTAAGIL